MSMRNFNTGATRDTDEGKINYNDILPAIVFEAYGKYMDKHRLQADGKLRDSDNWQQGFGENHLDVCAKSMYRHLIDVQKELDGYKSRDGINEALGGLMFNTIAYWYWILKDVE